MVEPSPEELAYQVALLVSQGWRRLAEDLWDHPEGLEYQYGLREWPRQAALEAVELAASDRTHPDSDG